MNLVKEFWYFDNMEEHNQSSVTLQCFDNACQQIRSQFDYAQQRVAEVCNKLAEPGSDFAVTQ